MITAMPRLAIAVNDFGDAVETFRNNFGLPVHDFSDRTVPDLGAHVGMCTPEGGSNIELMAPANRDLPLSQALQKFLDRRGEGLYALMLEAPDPDAEATGLLDRGVKVLPLMEGAGGRDIHPSATHGVLIRIYPNDSAQVPGGPSPASSGLSGIATAIVATADAALAAETYRSGLGLEVDGPEPDGERGVLVARCHPPKGGTIELVSVVDRTRPFGRAIADHLAERGQGLYALVLQADDPAAVTSQLSSRGVRRADSDRCELSAYGTRFLITS